MAPSVKQEAGKEQVQARLKALAEEIAINLSQLEGLQRKEVLSDFVSDLFLSVAKQDQQEVRRRRQADGIAAAKARGVRFGPSRKPLPEDFDEYYEAWRDGRMTLSQAAQACGMTRTTFTQTIERRKENCSA